MLVVMKQNASEDEVKTVINYIENNGFRAHVSEGEINTVIGAVGGKSMDKRNLEILDGVQEVIKISSSYKLVSRTFRSEDSVVTVKGKEVIGGKSLCLIAGPCTVESYEQMRDTAAALKQIGVPIILRGGAFKPRTSPYSFQGLGEEGLQILRRVADEFDMLVASEIMEISQLSLFLKYADILQVGARNMQNFNLVRELGTIDKPVILKRGLSATIEEWLMSAEYIMSGGNRNVILCERGIRTYETATRNTLDLSAIPVVKKLSHLPIIVDPSHATGIRNKVAPMARASVAAGADGVMIEVHHCPDKAVCDGPQSLYPDQFASLVSDLGVIAPVVGKEVVKI